MATKDEAISTTGYSSTARKVMVLGADGTGIASATNPLPVDANVTVDTMNLTAEMKIDTGHDFYVTTSNVGDDTDTITFDTVTGLALADIQSVENKTQGWVYNTAGATVTDTTIVLDLTEQVTGYPVPGASDEFEIVYRGASRFDDIEVSTELLDDTVVTLGDDTYSEATSKGIVIGGVRNDAGTSLADTDQEFAPLQFNANGMLNTNLDNIRDTAPDIGVGAAGSGTLRVATATDSTIATVSAVTEITNALPAGTNAIGKLAANSGVDIGDVDVTSCALPTGAATSALQTSSEALLTTIDADTSSIDGKITACDTGAVVISSGTVTAVTDITNTVTVDSTDLDIRDLTHVSDSVQIGDGTETAAVNASNQLEVSVNSSAGLEVVQDTAADLNVTEANSATIAGDTTSIDGKITACNTGSVTPAGKSSIVLAADGQVKATAGTVYAVLVSAVGVTAADKVEIKNSADNSGTALLTFVADAANGTWAFYPCVGVTFDTGIYSDETKSGGTFTVTVVYE